MDPVIIGGVATHTFPEELTGLGGSLTRCVASQASARVANRGELSPLLEASIEMFRFRLTFVRLNDPKGGSATESTRVTNPSGASAHACEVNG